MNITPHSKVIAIGLKPFAQRNVSRWMQKAALGALVSLAASSAFAHGSHDHQHSTIGTQQSQTQIASAQILPAQFAATAFEQKMSDQKLDWAANSHVNGDHLLRQWESGGVTPAQAIELINVLMLTQSPVVATTQQALDFAVAQSNATKNIFDVKNERNAMFFLRSTDTLELVKNNTLSNVEVMVLSEFDSPSWSDVHAYWGKFSSDRLSDAVQSNNSTDFSAARQKLIAAVDDAGLTSLRIPLTTWSSPQRVELLAQRIEQANTQLQQLTGWDGKVLGMNNQLSVNIMKPGSSCVTYQTQQGQIAITSSWEDLAHEWLHGMQAVVARQQVGAEGLTQAFDISGKQQSQLQSTWGTVLTEVTTHASSQAWQNNLNQYLNGSNTVQPARSVQWDNMETARAYYTSPSETMAYAWGSYVQSQLPANSALQPQSTNHNVADGVIAPTADQAIGQKDTWTAAFQKLKPWWEGQLDSQASPIRASVVASKLRAHRIAQQPAVGVRYAQ